MQDKFESHGKTFDAEFFTKENGAMIRFYDKKMEHCLLSNLVIVTPSYGTLLVQYIDEDAVLGGTLDKKHFNKDMVDDIISFVENNLPKCKNVYMPYHFDFISVDLADYDEYNGEY